MWVPQSICVELSDPPFGESRRALEGQHQLLADGLVVVNALEYVDWSRSHGQLHVCSHCGSEGCSGTNYGGVRRAGDYVLLTPAWAQMAEGAWEAEEYAPPDAIASHGTLVLTLEQAEQVSWRSLKSATHCSRLSGAELLRILQHEAPWNALGVFPDEVAVRRDALLASSRDDLGKAAQELSAALLRFTAADSVALRERTAADEEVAFYLDGPTYSTWPAYTESGGLLLAPSFVAFPAVT